jgi:conjugative transfer signal peptidase TraF
VTVLRPGPARGRPVALLACMAASLAALVLPATLRLPVRVVYNPSDSVPHGWYRIDAASSLNVGDLVLTGLPEAAAALAVQRDYLPAGVPLLKRVAAVAPQHVCSDGATVSVDGWPTANTLAADSRGQSLPVWRQCRRLSEGEVFLLSTSHPASFDSRYFGPVTASAVIGLARPVWTFGTARRSR